MLIYIKNLQAISISVDGSYIQDYWARYKDPSR